MRTQDLEIREKLAVYLAGESSLAEFDLWFASATWDANAASSLAAEIELAIDEHTSGHWPEGELRRLLRPLVQHYAVSVPEPVATTASSARVIHLRRVLGEALPPFSVVDTRPVEVSG